ncbi:MAG: hypothetical protein AAGG01_02285, partial [Planctomycetota bacterium]
QRRRRDRSHAGRVHAAGLPLGERDAFAAWISARRQRHPGGFDRSRGNDVNDPGVVVGTSFNPGGFSTSGDEQAYLWTGGVAIEIPVPESSGEAINAHGLVVGDSEQGPFLYDSQSGQVRSWKRLPACPETSSS